MTSLILTGGVISTKMLSLSIYGHKKRSPKGCNSLQSFIFCGYLVVMTYLRGCQLVRIFFQPERTETAFNLRELRLIVASIDFVRTKAVIKLLIFLMTVIIELLWILCLHGLIFRISFFQKPAVSDFVINCTLPFQVRFISSYNIPDLKSHSFNG